VCTHHVAFALDWAGDGAERLRAFIGAKELYIAIVEHAPEAGQSNGRRQAMSFAGDRKRVATGASTS